MRSTTSRNVVHRSLDVPRWLTYHDLIATHVLKMSFGVNYLPAVVMAEVRTQRVCSRLTIVALPLGRFHTNRFYLRVLDCARHILSRKVGMQVILVQINRADIPDSFIYFMILLIYVVA